MCSHTYTSSSQKRCPWPGIYDVLKRLPGSVLTSKLDGFDIDLSMDEQGLCLYHSQDTVWKVSRQMNSQFKLLTSAIWIAQKAGTLDLPVWDFEGFVFDPQLEIYPSESEVPDQLENINLSELILPQCTVFDYCIFRGTTWFCYSTFHKISSFSYARFEGDCDFSDVTFSARISFEQVRFQAASFRNTNFNASFDCRMSEFRNAAFNQTSFKSYACFEDCRFAAAYFTDCEFSRDINSAMANFRQTRFDYLIMDRLIFDREVDFGNASFHTGELIDVKFSPEKITIFDHISVASQLIIKGRSAEEKIFNHTVSFAVNAADLAGQIVFENTNLYFIQQTMLIRELAVKSVGKIIMGPGCDKYRLKKEFNIPLRKEWLFLMEEMALTYVSFFNWDNPAQIAINVECEYFREHVLVRYFADADISQRSFDSILEEKAPIFYTFLTDPVMFMKQYYDQNAARVSSQELVGDIDIFRRIQSARIGIASRIIHEGNWGVEQTLNLLRGIAQNPDSRVAIEFNNYVINQKDFFSFGSKKYVAGGNISLNAENL